MTEQSTNSDAPAPDEYEVSVFGPGVGECVVVHLGRNEWLVMDSLTERQDAPPVALTYLEAIGVGLERVRVIVASHWHDDHTRGLARLLEACPEAAFYCSRAFGDRDVQVMVDLHGGEPPRVGGGTRELWKVFQWLETQHRPLQTVGPQQTLYRREQSADDHAVMVTSLSPSHRAIQASIESMISMIPIDGEPRTFLPFHSPNHNAIVLLLQLGDGSVLLGGDLEEVSDEVGWTAILQDPLRHSGQAEVFKLPHHGSMNAYVPGVWTAMLTARPFVALAPFRQGSVELPQPVSRTTICGHTDRAYISSNDGRPPPALRRDAAVTRTIREASIRLHPQTSQPGQVRFRRRSSGDWQVALFGAAAPLCN
ncbi:MAG TPA: MBL fold metallo-hydrolase [Candidatus Dormibacteraeota bacterium]|nr:MBL fold metallo-hydrolase [Candidatus Dormibacteraeota bacterium]